MTEREERERERGGVEERESLSVCRYRVWGRKERGRWRESDLGCDQVPEQSDQDFPFLWPSSS